MWQANSVQFVWFCTNPAGIDASGLYQTWFSEEPDKTQRLKNGPNGPTSVAQGSIGTFDVLLQFTVGRLDAVVSVSAGDEVVKLASVEEMMEVIYPTFSRAKVNLGEVSRVSIIASIQIPTDSMESGNRVFNALCGTALPESASDLMFQINMVDESTLPHDAKLNRLTRISVSAHKTMLIKINTDPNDKNPTHIPLGNTQWSTDILMDYNTVPENKLISQAEQIDIIGKIAEQIIQTSATETLTGIAP
jgi:hypothetical protein